MEEKNSENSDKPTKSKLKRFLDEAGKVIKTMAGTPRVVRMVWNTNPLLAFWSAVLGFIFGVIPLAHLWIGKLVVDAVTTSVSKSNFELSNFFSTLMHSNLLPLLLAMAGIELVQNLIQPINRYVGDRLGDALSRHVNELILRKANSFVDITFFESSKFYDNLQKAIQEAGYKPVHMFDRLLDIARGLVTFLIMSVSFFMLQPILSILVLLFALPNLVMQVRHHKESWAIHQWETPEVRKMYYYRRVLTDKQTASEVRLFNLGDFFLDKYLHIFEEFSKRHQKIRHKHLWQNIIFGSIGGFADMAAYAYLALRTVSGGLSVGSFYFYSSALSQMHRQLWMLIWSVSYLYEDNLFLNNLFEFLDIKPTMVPADPTWALKAPKPFRKGIEFRNVSFHYEGSDKNVLDGLNFTLAPNQTVALVGENGAGKTTIVKLLGRLYDPSEGEILIDGVNLKDLDLDSWRAQMAVIFQDFAHYHLTAGENIGIGDVGFISDEIRIKAAAERGGAKAVVDKLPNKYDTMLVKGYGSKDDEASDLSGGEWQKMALSRAFMRVPQAEINGFDRKVEKHLKDGAAQVLVLDEPTAALDAQSEHDVYMRFQELTKGKTTVLISHRFSTVRMANHILLLGSGKIQESGTHEELMALGGSYAELYNLQADKYK